MDKIYINFDLETNSMSAVVVLKEKSSWNEAKDRCKEALPGFFQVKIAVGSSEAHQLVLSEKSSDPDACKQLRMSISIFENLTSIRHVEIRM